MNRIKLAGLLGTALALAACGGGDSGDAADAPESATASATSSSTTADATSGTVSTDDAGTDAGATDPAAAVAAAPPVAFNQCKSCHSVKPGDHGIGPSLAGIFGTKAGDIEGFEFSSAMKESGLVWDEATLDTFLLDPRGTIPGTKMSFAGLKDDAKRQEVIAYLQSL